MPLMRASTTRARLTLSVGVCGSPAWSVTAAQRRLLARWDAPSALTFARGILRTGTLDIGAYGTLRLEEGSNAGQTVNFTADGLHEFLSLGQAGDFGGTISGFGGTNIIVAQDLLADQRSFANGVLTLSEGSTIEAQLHLSGSYTTNDFRLSTSGGNTSIHFV